MGLIFSTLTNKIKSKSGFFFFKKKNLYWTEEYSPLSIQDFQKADVHSQKQQLLSKRI